MSQLQSRDDETVALRECLRRARLDHRVSGLAQHGVTDLKRLSKLTPAEFASCGITCTDERCKLARLVSLLQPSRINRAASTVERTSNNVQTSAGSKKRAQSSPCSTVHAASSVPGSSGAGPGWARPGVHVTPGSATASTVRLSGNQAMKLRKTTETNIVFVRPCDSGTADDNGNRSASNSTDFRFNSETRLHLATAPNSRQLSAAGRDVITDRQCTDSMKQWSQTTTNIDDGDSDPRFQEHEISQPTHTENVYYTSGYNYGVLSASSTPRSTASPVWSPAGTAVDRIRVCVRKRPRTNDEVECEDPDIVSIQGSKSVIVDELKSALDMKKFVQRHVLMFDEVFDETCENLYVYANAVQPIVNSLFNRRLLVTEFAETIQIGKQFQTVIRSPCDETGSAVCFAFGQTGAGKTHTLLGTRSQPGLYRLAATDLFSMMQQYNEELAASVSYYEIYCNRLYDLFNRRQRLHIREDAKHNVCVVDLLELPITDVKSLVKLITYGNKLRRRGSTGVNPNSSRSHALVQLQVRNSNSVIVARLTFIDLAGSERAADAVNNDRKTKLEGAEINQSLLALKECIRCIDQSAAHSPYRQSKLTHLLRDSFLGHSPTVMIANIAPTRSACQNTLNTLRYAARVQELKKEVARRMMKRTRLVSHVGLYEASNSPFSTPRSFTSVTSSTPTTPASIRSRSEVSNINASPRKFHKLPISGNTSVASTQSSSRINGNRSAVAKRPTDELTHDRIRAILSRDLPSSDKPGRISGRLATSATRSSPVNCNEPVCKQSASNHVAVPENQSKMRRLDDVLKRRDEAEFRRLKEEKLHNEPPQTKRDVSAARLAQGKETVTQCNEIVPTAGNVNSSAGSSPSRIGRPVRCCAATGCKESRPVEIVRSSVRHRNCIAANYHPVTPPPSCDAVCSQCRNEYRVMTTNPSITNDTRRMSWSGGVCRFNVDHEQYRESNCECRSPSTRDQDYLTPGCDRAVDFRSRHHSLTRPAGRSADQRHKRRFLDSNFTEVGRRTVSVSDDLNAASEVQPNLWRAPGFEDLRQLSPGPAAARTASDVESSTSNRTKHHVTSSAENEAQLPDACHVLWSKSTSSHPPVAVTNVENSRNSSSKPPPCERHDKFHIDHHTSKRLFMNVPHTSHSTGSLMAMHRSDAEKFIKPSSECMTDASGQTNGREQRKSTSEVDRPKNTLQTHQFNNTQSCHSAKPDMGGQKVVNPTSPRKPLWSSPLVGDKSATIAKYGSKYVMPFGSTSSTTRNEDRKNESSHNDVSNSRSPRDGGKVIWNADASQRRGVFSPSRATAFLLSGRRRSVTPEMFEDLSAKINDLITRQDKLERESQISILAAVRSAAALAAAPKESRATVCSVPSVAVTLPAATVSSTLSRSDVGVQVGAGLAVVNESTETVHTIATCTQSDENTDSGNSKTGVDLGKTQNAAAVDASDQQVIAGNDDGNVLKRSITPRVRISDIVDCIDEEDTADRQRHNAESRTNAKSPSFPFDIVGFHQLDLGDIVDVVRGSTSLQNIEEDEGPWHLRTTASHHQQMQQQRRPHSFNNLEMSVVRDADEVATRWKRFKSSMSDTSSSRRIKSPLRMNSTGLSFHRTFSPRHTGQNHGDVVVNGCLQQDGDREETDFELSDELAADELSSLNEDRHRKAFTYVVSAGWSRSQRDAQDKAPQIKLRSSKSDNGPGNSANDSSSSHDSADCRAPSKSRPPSGTNASDKLFEHIDRRQAKEFDKEEDLNDDDDDDAE